MTDVYNCPSCGEESICTPECEGLRVAFRDITHRVEVAEQELRETAGELEKARTELASSRAKYGCYKHSAMQTVGSLRLKLTEATALLDDLDWAICGEGPRYHVEPELKHRLAEWRNVASRAPGHPAACPACGHLESRHCGADDCPQPAAPTPECRYYGSFCGDTSCPTHGIEQPAAPEPSADAVLSLIAWVVRNAEDLADFVGNNPDLLRDMAMAAKRVHDRDRSAEAQLAAVYEIVNEVECNPDATDYKRAFHAIRDLFKLTPAPSPGAGGGTDG